MDYVKCYVFIQSITRMKEEDAALVVTQYCVRPQMEAVV